MARVMWIRVVALGGNVCSGLLTAAWLGPAGRGEQAALVVAPTVLAALCTLGLHASLIYNLRADPEEGGRYFGAAMILTCATGLAATAIGFLLLPEWLGRYSSGTVTFARLLLFAVPFGVVTPLLSGVLEANGQFALANRVLYFQSLGALATLLLLAAFGLLTPISAAAAYFVPTVPSFLFLLARAQAVLRPRFTVAAPYPRRLLRYGIRFYGVDILGAMSGYLDQVVIVFLLQPAAVGAYAVALSLSRVLNVAQGAIATVLFPSIAAREAASVVATVARAMRVTTVVNATGAMAIGVAGPSLLLLLYGTRFAAAVLPFQVLLIEAVVSSAARTLAQAFSGTGRPSVVTGVEVAGVTTSLATMLVLVPAYGIVGAAGATLLGGMVRLSCVLVSFRKVLGIDLPRLLISRADVAWMAGR
ncbi:polysaccharide biosynthesis C-terminal domain-containing protein [Lichenicoccus sp.]|uniref:oligosaccharide flippase family protein n=1 Tax=Lichenicoccus sp. TaxID=2781899 RepID=UPI003D11F76F